MLRPTISIMVILLAVSLSHAQSVYLVLPTTDIPTVEDDPKLSVWWTPQEVWVSIDGPGEAYFYTRPFGFGMDDPSSEGLLLALPQAREVTGTIHLAEGQYRFTIAADRFSDDDETRLSYYRGKAAYYDALRAWSLPGSAWFRHQADQALEHIPLWERPARDGEDNPRTAQIEEDRSLALFTGGRAVAENLALDRSLPTPTDENATEDLAGLRGITTPDFNWKPLLADAPPELDPMATCIPHDQHAIFFSSVAAFEATMTAARRQLLPVMQWTEQGASAEAVLDRYRRQLLSGVPLEQVREMAITGSDPYFRTGTDVALLLLTDHPGALAASARPEDARTSVTVVGQAVVVTNSVAQLSRLQAVAAGEQASLASLDEYRFFRQRYVRGGDEAALLVLSDATIRRWCGPRWRIASGRRTRAISQLAERQALRMSEDDPRPVVDDDWGSLAFLTPIVEMAFDKVTPAEAEAYNRWREGYESGWRQAFDPIALQLKLVEGRVQTDLTVMPLIAGSEYQQMVNLSGEARISPRAADPHDGTVLHLVMAIDPKARQMEGWGQLAQSMLQLNADPWAWMDQTVSIYLERDPVWQELAETAADDPQIWASSINRLPVAIHADVKSAMRLVGFLAGIRAFIEQSAPGMVQFNTRSHQEQAYVEVTIRDLGIEDVEPRIYYLATSKALVVSLNEDLIRRVIERHASPEAPQPAAPTWLGEHVALAIEGDAIKWISQGGRAELQDHARQQAWASLPILNEWRRLHPDRDPVELHQRVWHQDLGDPADYRWNDAWQTMESVTWGHPGQPRTPDAPPIPGIVRSLQNAKLGLTFENQGLRARANLDLQE